MKKLFLAFAVFAAMMFASGTALAAEIVITTDPAQITAAGSMDIKITITNDSSEMMSRIGAVGHGINNPEALYNLTLSPGMSQPMTVRNVGINESMLGTPQVYTFTWLEGTAQKSKEVTVTFGAAAQPTAAMTATRSFSKDAGKEGDKITITYTLKNPSTVSMTNVTVKDSLAGSGAIKEAFTLEPGVSQNVTYEYTLGKEDAVSQPTVTYQVNGEEKSLTIASATIKITNVSLQATVSQGDPSEEGTLFTILLTNDGNQDISKISVTDELGAKVNEDTFTLKAGEQRTLTFLVKTETLRNVTFTITGTDALGQPYENRTRSSEARPYVNPDNIKFTMFVTVMEPLSESGRMKVLFSIKNDSAVDISNASISEEELGVLESRSSLAAGETAIEKELRISAPRELQFTLSAYDPSGTEHTYQAQVPAAYMPSTTPDPEQTIDVTDPEELEETEPAKPNDTLITVLIVLAALMGVAGIALLVLSIYEKKKGDAMPDYESGDTVPVRGPQATARSAKQEEQKYRPAQRPRGHQEDDEEPVTAYAPENRAVRNAVRQRPERERPRQTPARDDAAKKPFVEPVEQPVFRPSAEPQQQQRGASFRRPIEQPPAQEPDTSFAPPERERPYMPPQDQHAERRPFVPRATEPERKAPRSVPAQEVNAPQDAAQSTKPTPAAPGSAPGSVRNRVHRIKPVDVERE